MIDTVVVRALNDARFWQQLRLAPGRLCRQYGLTSEELAALKSLAPNRVK